MPILPTSKNAVAVLTGVRRAQSPLLTATCVCRPDLGCEKNPDTFLVGFIAPLWVKAVWKKIQTEANLFKDGFRKHYI